MRFPFQLLAETEFDVIGCGTNAVDHLIRVPEYPRLDSKIELIEHMEAPGGEAASTLVGLQRLGFKTLYAGRFGGDRAGEMGLASLAAEGVDISRAEIIAAARTQIAFILVDDQSGERTVIWQRDPRLAFTADDAPVDLARRGRILHMTAHDPAACGQMARASREQGLIVSLDIDNVFPNISELLPMIDICITSAGFLKDFLGIADQRRALSEMASRFGCVVVGCTNGSAGSILLCGNTFIQTRACDVPGGCVDTTGAGDAFRTGFLAGVLDGLEVEDAARVANAVAALKCRASGARTGLPNRAELNSLLEKSSGL